MKFLKKKLKLRLYQQTILASCYGRNSLVVLPTGLGKTYLAVGLAGLSFKKGIIVILAPTKPLCVQHQKTFSEFFKPEDELIVMTGAVRPIERKELWKKAKIVFCTPQTFERDVLHGYIGLEKVSLLVLDEVHRATGKYSYVWVSKQFATKSEGNILALSASPASSKERLKEVCDNLYIENIEIKTELDQEVSKYIQEKEIIRIELDLPKEIEEIKSLLELCLSSRLKKLKEVGLIGSSDVSKVRKIELLNIQRKLASELSSQNFEKYKQISIVASCLKLQHVLEMVQTQGIGNVVDFFKKLEKQAKTIKASKRLLADWNFRKAVIKAYDAAGSGVEHPKFGALKELLSKEFSKDMKVIIFAHYRSSINRLMDMLKEVDGLRPVKFIGQKEGMNQKLQVATLERFKEGKYNVLVASSISEEGLHIENADLGVFFEPVSSALRSIQRRGRIGRVNIGKIYLLITKGTIDEKYYWSAWHKERRMGDLLESLKEDMGSRQTVLGVENGG